MKTLIVATLLAATTFAASAQSGNGETYGQNSPTFGSEKSRAEVIVELRAAQDINSIAYGEHSQQSVLAQPATSGLTRQQVLQEVAALRKAGKLPVNGEFASRRL